MQKPFIVKSGLVVESNVFTANSTGLYRSNILLANNNGLVGSFTTVNASTNTATFGSAAFIVSNGNVGIGTSTPSQKLEINGSAYASGDFRAPIFYDSNDINYYVNPASNSKLTSLDVGNINTTGNSQFSLHLGVNQINSGYFWNNVTELAINYSGYQGGNTQFRNTRIFDGKSDSIAFFQGSDKGTYLYGPVFAPIFYDSSDYNYYLNLNSRSRLHSLTLETNQFVNSSEGWNRIYFQNGDASYYNGGTTSQWVHNFRTQDNVTRWLMSSSGDFWATGNITAYWSDKRLKKNIEKIKDWREIINGMNGYRFQWNDTGKKLLEKDNDEIEVGLIAQEVKEVLPQASAIQMLQYKDKQGGVLIPKDNINYDSENPYLTVREEKIIPVLVEAIKGLLKEVDELKQKFEK